MRKIKTAVTIFLHCRGRYLFLHRSADRQVDANRINGIGGKVEPGENYLQAAIRETEEETGYQVSSDQIKFLGLIRLEGGYADDWLSAFFKIEVPTTEIPIGDVCAEGRFLWLKPDELFEQPHELVDDLHYLFKQYVNTDEIFFANAQLNQDEKIEKFELSELSCLINSELEEELS